VLNSNYIDSAVEVHFVDSYGCIAVFVECRRYTVLYYVWIMDLHVITGISFKMGKIYISISAVMIECSLKQKNGKKGFFPRDPYVFTPPRPLVAFSLYVRGNIP
jgi:hypothetical protein